ncbi:MAG: hypothetical protein GY822_02695 [Deltaproteobacteria bacterium]|nr:hypothetical protein [Deltaproteobacteria bacterium]
MLMRLSSTNSEIFQSVPGSSPNATPTFAGFLQKYVAVMILATFSLTTMGADCGDGLTVVPPSLKANPEEVSLDAAISQVTDIRILLENNSNVTASIREIYLDGPDCVLFQLSDDLPSTVAGQGAEPIDVVIRPLVENTSICTLVILPEEGVFVGRDDEGEDLSVLEIPIEVRAADRGLPDIEVAPLLLEFGRVGQNDVVRDTLTISNVGIRDLIIDETRFLPNEEGDESIRLTSPVPPGYLLSPGRSITVDLLFAPIDVEEHRGLLQILSNDPDEALIEIPVFGRGHQCPIALAELLEDPEAIEPLDTIRLDGHGSFTEVPDAAIEGYEWVLEQRPVGSTATLTNPGADRTELTCDIAGEYQVRLTVTDDTGIRSCNDAVVRFTAKPTADLHIQLVWDHPDADLDLHLVREDGEAFDHDWDVYFSNRFPPWYPDVENNPTLDEDDARGYGPENINVKTPLPGSRWRVLTHYWSKQTDGDPYTLASLRIYAKGQLVADISQSFSDDQVLWEALEIVWSDDPEALPQVNQLNQTLPYPRPF